MEDIKKALAGDSCIFDRLYKQYHPVVYSLSKKYYLKGYDQEDWLQEGRILFHRSLERFDGTMQSSIGKFFKRNFENHVRSLLRKQSAYKRTIDAKAVSLDQRLENRGEDWSEYLGIEISNPLETLIIQEKLAEYPALLSPFERITFQEYIRGKELETIANDQIMTLATVRSAYDRAKKKMRQLLIE